MELALQQEKAKQLRADIVKMTYLAKSGHPGGSMSCMDVLTYLYFAEMHVDPKNPHDPGRDRFVMSKGHCSPAVYPTLALRGFFPVEDLPTLRHIDSYLQGHPNMNTVPWARASPLPSAWRWPARSQARTTASIRSWATAKLPRVRSGKP